MTVYHQRKDPEIRWNSSDFYLTESDIMEIRKQYGNDDYRVERWEEEGDYFDEDECDWSWEDTCEHLTLMMKTITKDRSFFGYWTARVSNFGWRSLNGSKEFKAEDGAEFLRQVLPNTDCTFNVFYADIDGTEPAKPGAILIQNFHHDSPMGNEWYTITPSWESDEDEDEEKGDSEDDA